MDIPSARAEISAHSRSRSACSNRHTARVTRTNTRRRRRPASTRLLIVVTRDSLPAAFSKLNTIAVFMGPLLPTPLLQVVLYRKELQGDPENPGLTWANTARACTKHSFRAGQTPSPPCTKHS